MGEKLGISAAARLTPARSSIYTFARLTVFTEAIRQNRYANRSRTEQEGGQLVNKNELVDAVAAVTELTKADAAKAVDAVFDSITKSLKKGHEVRLVGFGTFNVRKRAASLGRNPRTGEPLKIPASKQPKFKAGKGLKDAVN
jgi:DNA-binding protein HU-beta